MKARDSIFNEMCSEMGISDFQNVREVYLNKRNITKDKLISWLETMCFILDTYSVPLLKNAVTVAERADDLKEEKILDQKSIIELQQKLIEKKDAELNNVQKTVQTEMKTYSSVVSKSCAAVFAPKKIEAVVKNVADREERCRNVILYGIQEKAEESLKEEVENVLIEIGEKPVVKG